MVTVLLKIALKHSAEGLSCVPRKRKAVRCLVALMCVPEEPRSGTGYSAVATSSVITNQKHVVKHSRLSVNGDSSNRHTCCRLPERSASCLSVLGTSIWPLPPRVGTG